MLVHSLVLIRLIASHRIVSYRVYVYVCMYVYVCVGTVLDTQWLFPRDMVPLRGRAYGKDDNSLSTPSFDGVFRVWKKSDPATTGAYDRESVDYIGDPTLRPANVTTTYHEYCIKNGRANTVIISSICV
jgi:hypothetical protein